MHIDHHTFEQAEWIAAAHPFHHRGIDAHRADQQPSGPQGKERGAADRHALQHDSAENDLLRLFMRNEGKLLTHPAILREVWGPAYREESNYLHVYVSHLRRKIEPDPARPRYLLTEPGVGYRLVNPS